MSDSTTTEVTETFPVPPGTLTMPAAVSEDTVAFTPDWDEPATARPRVRTGCGCGTSACPDEEHQPDPDMKDAMLSCAPGVVTRMSRERVRNGQWENIPAYVRSRAGDIHRHAVEKLAGIRLEVEHGVLDIAPLFDRNPELHRDLELSRELHRYEADLAFQLADMRRRAAEGEKQPWHRIARRAA